MPVFAGFGVQDAIPSDVDSIIVTIHHPPDSDIVIARRIEPGQDSIVITIDVPLSSAGLDTVIMSMEAIRTVPAPPQVLYRADAVPLEVRAGQPTRMDTVRADYVGPGKNIRSITISPQSAVLAPGDSVSFTATAVDSAGEPIVGMPVLWDSRDDGVARISAWGTARAVADGTTRIVVTSGARAAVKDSAVLVVSAAPVAMISFAPSLVELTAQQGGPSPAPSTVAVTNAGAGPLTGMTVSSIQYQSGQTAGWLTATLSGTSAPATLTLQATTGSLAPGTYNASVPIVSSLAANSPHLLAVTFNVSAGPSIGLSPSTVTVIDTVTTGDPAARTVAVTNTGGGTLSGLAVGTITYGASQPTGWLTSATLDVTTAPATLTLMLAKGSLTDGVYTATVPIISTVAGNSPQNVTVTFDVRPLPLIGLSATTASFVDTMTTADPAAQTVTVTNAGTGTLSGLAVGTISYASGAGWLSASLDQAVAPATLTLSVAKGAMLPGLYSATVPVTAAVAGNTPQNVTVTFDLRPMPLIGLAPAAVTVVDTLLSPDPASRTVTVSNAGTGTLSGLAVGAIDYGGGSAGWLTATLDGPTAPATLTLTLAKDTLSAGTYTATVPIISTVAGNSPQNVTVTFDVRPLPLVRMVVTPGYGVLPPVGMLPLSVQGFNSADGPAPAFGLKYLSRSPGVATVDSLTGVVTGVSTGSAVIVAAAPGTVGMVYDSTLVAVAGDGVAVALPVSNGRAFSTAGVTDTVHVLVTVNLGSVPGERLGSYNAQLNWSSGVLRYVSTTPIGFAAPTLNENNVLAGELRFGAIDAAGTAGPTIVVVDVKLVADAVGASPLTFSLSDLSGVSPAFTQMLTQAQVLSGGVQVK